MARKPLKDGRESAIEALMELAAERPWREIALPEIAARAGLTLAELRELYPSKGAILAGFSRMVDTRVLEGGSADMAEEPARERLFDVLMRRFEILKPYRAALRSIRRGVIGDPLAMSALNRVAVTSQQWMLAGANIPEAGPLGGFKAQALALLTARVTETFLRDEDEGLAATMRKLDGELRRAERFVEGVEKLKEFRSPFAALRNCLDACRSRRSRDAQDEGPAEDYAPAI